jgi:hypothetical protein
MNRASKLTEERLAAVSMPPDYFYPERRYPRKHYSGRAIILYGTTTELGETIEISEGGLLLRTTLLLRPGDQVSVHFIIPNAYIRTTGEVIYLLPNLEDPNSCQVGVRFTSISDVDKSLIQKFIKKLSRK